MISGQSGKAFMRVLLSMTSGALALVLLTGAAGDMSVATFLGKAERLQKKGPLAMMSPDLKLLMGEMKGAGKAYRARLDADKAAGRPPHSCPPAKMAMNSNEVLAHFRSYPVAERPKISVTTAFGDLSRKRYPCG